MAERRTVYVMLLAFLALCTIVPVISAGVWPASAGLFLTAALAQEPGRIQASESYGVETVTVDSAARAGQQATVTVDGREYAGKFDQSGRFKCQVAVPIGNERIDVDLDDASFPQIQATGRDLRRILLVVLRWRQPIDFGLNILEPGGTAISRAHDVGVNGGSLALFGHGCGSGWHEEVFTVLGRDTSSHDKYYIRVDYLLAGDIPTGDYCGIGKYAKPEFELIVVDRGRPSCTTVHIPPVACGRPLSPEQRQVEVHPFGRC